MAGRAGSVPPCATIAAAVTVDSGSRDGMFVLEVKVQGFAFKDSAGRKSYTKGHMFKWDVKYGSMTFDLLLKNLATELNLSTDQTPTVWFFDKRLNEDARIVGEIQMLDLFEMYKKEMSCQVVVGVFDRSICVQTEFDAMEPLCVVPRNDANVQLEAEATATLSKEPSSAAPENPEAFVDVEPDREHDIFDNAEEYVGVDDEAMYGIVPVAPQFAKPTDNANSNVHEPTCDEPSDAFFHVEAEVDDADPLVVQVLHDPNNPKIVEGELFPDIVAFRKAIRHYAVTKGFELAAGYKSDKSRFTARCAAEGCPWRIHASTIFDKKTVQIKKLPSAHNCPTTKLQVGRMASQGWCSDKLGDWVKKNPTKKAKEAKEKLEGDFGIKLKYSKAWSGLKVALDKVHGTYEESFQLLFNWAAQLKQNSPGSHVEIEIEKIGKKNRFKRIFVALKPCIDGFLAGCRPFIGVDASFLHGKYTGQLAAATGVDGHNWLYHIAYAVFDSETEDNWTWFLQNLHKVIGDPPGLVLCSDACKGLEKAVGAVFPHAENRECMRHLYSNFMKHFSGDVFTDHLYPAAKNYTDYMFKWHMNKIYEFAPDALKYLDQYHSRVWYRSAFSEDSKCDYLTNNVSESFNAQIKHLKGLLIHELVDRIRELIMEKRYIRRKIGQQMQDEILLDVLKELNLRSTNLNVVKVKVSDDDFAEVTLRDDWEQQRRYTVDLKNHSCSCREWQVTGKPCKHALAWILSNRGMRIADFVHEYYLVARFRAAYEGRVEPMTDRSQWPQVDLGFKVHPPLLGRPPGRPKVQRQRSYLETEDNKRKVKCKRCGGFGHFEKPCKLDMVGEDGEVARPKKRKRTNGAVDDAGPSQAQKKDAAQNKTGKKKKSPKKKRSPKKKKTPLRKKQQKDAAAPPARVVRSLMDMFSARK